LKLGELGEQGLLQLLQSFCEPGLVGDDAAILVPEPGLSLVVTADTLVDGVHFSDRTTSPFDAGWRAAAANLSDLAAMGASPFAMTVALGLPPTTEVDWLRSLYEGLSNCLATYNMPLVGGDVCRSPTKTIAITALGQVTPQRVIRRDQAHSGDVVVATGWHGASRAGLELLLNPDLGQKLQPQDYQACVQAHQRPRPRLDVVAQIWQSYEELGLDVSPIAGMDTSDGLADAVCQICRASGVGAILDHQMLPVPPFFQDWLDPDQALDWTLYGGEDFELVLCLKPEVAQKLVARIGGHAAVIGTITADDRQPAVYLINAPTLATIVTLDLRQSFQHFEVAN